MLRQWPNDPDDDGNAIAGAWHAALIVLGSVALALLLYWLV
jgi:hypothetical protein